MPTRRTIRSISLSVAKSEIVGTTISPVNRVKTKSAIWLSNRCCRAWIRSQMVERSQLQILIKTGDRISLFATLTPLNCNCFKTKSNPSTTLLPCVSRGLQEPRELTKTQRANRVATDTELLVTLKLDNGQEILREFRCGEGFAAQNSDTMLVGIGSAEFVKQVDVRWPSGQQQQTGPISKGQLLNIHEGQETKTADAVAYRESKPD